MFINSLDEGIEWTLSRFGDDTELEEWLIHLRAGLHSEGPGQIAELDREKLNELQQGQVQVLHLGRDKPRYQHRLGVTYWRAALQTRTRGSMS